MDMQKELNRLLTTGQVYMGAREALKHNDEVKLFIMASNCPEKQAVLEAAEDTPLFVYQGSAMQLGMLCRKPFSVSVISVVDEGTSNIMELSR
jgi:large subunit ribosomal protein L30e